MRKQRFPSEPVEETPEQYELRRSISDTTYERDQAFFKALDEARRGKDTQWTGHYE